MNYEFLGPPLDQGPMPALLYFSLSAKESLHLAPFNTPIASLDLTKMRVFSLTLPAHGEGFDKHKAIGVWAEWIKEGKRPLVDCIEEACQFIDFLFAQNIASAVATSGLSRGGFIATHIAANDARVKAVLGYAPLTDLSYSADFAEIKDDPHVRKMALHNLYDSLINTPIRFYIGNRDTAVGTDRCFDFIFGLANRAFDQKVRSPHAELIISPSIGHRGHGTKEHNFKAGALWVQELVCTSS